MKKPAVQVSKSSPLTARERWVSRSKIERAATENNGKKPVITRRNAIDGPKPQNPERVGVEDMR